MFYFREGFSQKFDDAFLLQNSGMADFSDLGAALLLMFSLFLVIPIGGYLIGLIWELGGTIQNKNKKPFTVVGLTINLLIFAVGFVVYVIGILFGR